MKYVLPDFDTRKNLMLKIAIGQKLAISDSDQKRIVTKDMGGGMFSIGFTDAAAISDEVDIELSDDELLYLKQLVYAIDQNGMFSEFNISTYNKILDKPFAGENYQDLWDKMTTIPEPTPEFTPNPDSGLENSQSNETTTDPEIVIMKHIDQVEH